MVEYGVAARPSPYSALQTQLCSGAAARGGGVPPYPGLSFARLKLMNAGEPIVL